MDQNLRDILQTVNFIKDRMLSKDDVRKVVGEDLQTFGEQGRRHRRAP